MQQNERNLIIPERRWAKNEIKMIICMAAARDTVWRARLKEVECTHSVCVHNVC